MRKPTVMLLLAVLPDLGMAALPAQPVAPYREGEVLVKYRADAAATAAKQLKSNAGLTPRRTLLQGRAELLMLPGFTTTADMLEMLRNDPAVEYAEPNFRRYSRTVTPNDPLFGDQWGLRNTGQPNFFAGGPAGIAGGDLNLIEAWDSNNDGVADRVGIPGVIVAVIDDAVEITHPDLAPNIVQGHNFIACQDPNNPAPISGNGAHGTLVAGCVAGKGNNAFGIAGVAWNASLMPLKFGFDTASHIEALAYARDHGAKIINASFGGPGFSQMERDAIAGLAANDILYVAAAGNDDSNTDLAQLNYPANYDAGNIVSVAATNRQDNIASFSQYGPLTVDVAAPGLQIVTTEIGGGYRTSPGVSGTSFSSPYTAGVAALIRSHVPGVTARDIKARLIESGSSVTGANSKMRTVGGRVDADAALDMAAGPSLVIRAVNFTGGDGNAVMDSGETLSIAFTLRNIWQNATGVTATLTADNSVTVISGAQSPGMISAQGEAVATFEISAAPNITEHRYVTFTLTLTADGGYSASRSYIAEIGDLALGAPVTQSFADDPYDEFHAWQVDVPPALPPGIKTLIVRTSTPSGQDIDLLAKPGIPPQYSITVGINPELDSGFFCTSGTTNDCQDPNTLVSGRLDGVEAITIVNPAAGAYHLVVVNFDRQAVPYTLSAELVNGDLRPADFNFTDRTGIPPNTAVTSNSVTISGIDTPTFITIVGGEYSINNNPTFTSTEGTISPGNTLRVRANSGSGGFVRAQVTVGGVTETFSLNQPPFPSGGSGDVGCPTGGGGGGGSPGWSLLLIFAGAATRRRAFLKKNRCRPPAR